MPTPVLYALNFSRWKRAPLRACFPQARLVFVSRPAQIPAGAAVLVWGMQVLPDAAAHGWSVRRVEDGFLRSVGLGADLTRPLSWVVDERGMYFDATAPSDLEALLMDTDFSEALLARAAALRQRIVTGGLTKYNVGQPGWRRPPDARQVILVPGQVESDASLAWGAPGLRTNLGLLQAVRLANPLAHVVYKPHPDVLAGLRAPGALEASAAAWCNEVVGNVAMDSLLAEVDSVHVLTSLTGFEALLRGKPVTCHGLPFYAGWGLTEDRLPLPRRTRRLSLDELVAGALILYPRYMSRATRQSITPEAALDELLAWRSQHAGQGGLWRSLSRMVLRRVVGVR